MLSFREFIDAHEVLSLDEGPSPNQYIDPRRGKKWRAVNKVDQLRTFLNDQRKLGVKASSLWVHYTQYPKLGFNPQSQDGGTPFGIYAYPIEYVIGSNGIVPFGVDRNYLVVFKLLDKQGIIKIDSTDKVNKGVNVNKVPYDKLSDKKNYLKGINRGINKKNYKSLNLFKLPNISLNIIDELYEKHHKKIEEWVLKFLSIKVKNDLERDVLLEVIIDILDRAREHFKKDIPSDEKGQPGLFKQFNYILDNGLDYYVSYILGRLGDKSSELLLNFIDGIRDDEGRPKYQRDYSGQFGYSYDYRMILRSKNPYRPEITKLDKEYDEKEEHTEEEQLQYYHKRNELLNKLDDYNSEEYKSFSINDLPDDPAFQSEQFKMVRAKIDVYKKLQNSETKIKAAILKSLNKFKDMVKSYFEPIMSHATNDNFPFKNGLTKLAKEYNVPIEDFIRQVATFKANGQKFAYEITRRMAKEINRKTGRKYPIIWTELLRKMGIDGIIDPYGSSSIHGGENTQGVFFNIKKLETMLIIHNKSNVSTIDPSGRFGQSRYDDDRREVLFPGKTNRNRAFDMVPFSKRIDSSRDPRVLKISAMGIRLDHLAGKIYSELHQKLEKPVYLNYISLVTNELKNELLRVKYLPVTRQMMDLQSTLNKLVAVGGMPSSPEIAEFYRNQINAISSNARIAANQLDRVMHREKYEKPDRIEWDDDEFKDKNGF